MVEFMIFSFIIAFWFYSFSFLIFYDNGAISLRAMNMLRSIWYELKETIKSIAMLLVIFACSGVAYVIFVIGYKIGSYYLLIPLVLIFLVLVWKYGNDKYFKGWG